MGAAVALLLALVAVAAGGWLLLTGLAAGPAVSAAENAFAARVLAIDRFGYGAAHLAWYDGGLAALQAAGYERVAGTLGRATTAGTAAREAAGVATVLAAVALTVGARRLRLSGPAVVAVPVLFGLVPAAVLLHRVAEPAQFAVLWACAGLALAAGEARRTGAAVGAVGYLLLAVATAPVVLVALVPLSTMLVGSGSLGRLGPERRRAVAAAGLLLSALLAVLAATGLLPGGDAPVPALTPLDVALGVAAAGAGVLALRVSWLRPFAVALLVTAGTAAAAPELRGSLLLVALPLAAVVLPATVEQAVGALDRRQAPWFPGQAVVAGTLALAAALAWLPSAATLRRPVDTPGRAAVDDARGWVLANLPSRPALAVDGALWVALVRAGYPADRLAARGLGPGGVDPAAVRYVVGRDRALPAGAPAGTPVAGFGTGDDLVVVRRVPTPDDAAATQRDAAGRTAAGSALAGNPRLDLDPAAADLLRGGRVDARAVAVLAAATGEHTLRIADFPVVPGEDPAAPRRLLAVSAVDGTAVATGATAVARLRQWLAAQQPPYRPAGTELTGTVLLVRYDALGGTGLLPP